VTFRSTVRWSSINSYTGEQDLYFVNYLDLDLDKIMNIACM